MKLTTLEARRLEMFEAGRTVEEIAEMEGATIQSVKTSIWRAKAKREGTYKAPEQKKGEPKKKGFQFKEADLEKVNYIKNHYKNRYGMEMTDEEIIERALRSLFGETYDYEQIEKEKERKAKEKAEQEERERQEREEAERKQREQANRRKRRGFKYFTGYEENTKEIKKAFRKLSKELHPDNLETGDAEAFKEMMNEYERMMNR